MASPTMAVDIVIVYPDGDVVLIERGVEPFKGTWALPGGGVEIGETVEQAAVREAKEETGLDIRLEYLVGVYSDPGRDPRGHTVSIVYRAIPIGGELYADTDAAKVIKTSDYLNISLAFDHDRIIRDALDEG
ncbi:MAG: NUDIX hydrolase [candidate division Zixibacteria bacterium]|nr:NUDIX hydrolase [candidate division Zixibacteria bacterium]